MIFLETHKHKKQQLRFSYLTATSEKSSSGAALKNIKHMPVGHYIPSSLGTDGDVFIY